MIKKRINLTKTHLNRWSEGRNKIFAPTASLVARPHLTIFTTPSANPHSSPFAFLSFNQAREVNLDYTFFPVHKE
ncbi:hypothetical protein CMV_015067 [Castanea mollissima]|uniref:Uncharacterized protein n=1 Tax=Castanea mollissima TaxID=60419 RepID=A0A8J4QW33_9ROSI|nr:hypothetical protein CMV_015067 [Castanea mollissima]